MKKLIVFMVLLLLVSFSSLALADCPAEDLDCQIGEIQKEINALKPAHERNKQELAGLRKQLADLKAKINQLNNQVDELETDIFDREVNLGFQQELLGARIRSFYIHQRQFSPLLLLLASNNATHLMRRLSYQQSVANQDRLVITQISEEIIGLKEDKAILERSRENLAALQSQVDKQTQFLAGEVAKVESYLAELTSRQQQLLAQKFASLNLPATLGAGPLYCVDDRGVDPGFSPGFAFFTFGIPHRVGMNQYGAYGRAHAGQGYQDILRAYFNEVNFETRDNINITVDGYGTMPLETYLLGIYEMPADWPMEALKAQVVAARSYALAYTDNGAKSICPTQQCQVYKGGNKGGNWEAAVKATTGQILTHGGQIISAWYASTAGGYTFNSGDVGWGSTGWTKRMRDTAGEVNSWEDLFNQAFDKASPCFYSAQGWRKEYNKSAWLKSEEVADIVNVLLLAKADPSTQSHLPQVDKPNPDGVETWDAGRVKQELSNRGMSPYNSVSGVSVNWDKNLGQTVGVTVNGDAGSNNFGGSEFKDYFNLRAPANIAIVGPLFRVEQR